MKANPSFFEGRMILVISPVALVGLFMVHQNASILFIGVIRAAGLF